MKFTNTLLGLIVVGLIGIALQIHLTRGRVLDTLDTIFMEVNDTKHQAYLAVSIAESGLRCTGVDDQGDVALTCRVR